MNQKITPELIRAALEHIPAALPRDEWARVAMAIKSEFPDATGFDLFDAWSQTAGESYAAKATRGTWQSVKAGGKVGIGTLLHLAKRHGFKLPKAGASPAKPDAAALALRARERAERDAAERASTEAAHAAAALDAREQWQQASEAGSCPYLTRKGVQAHGVRFTPDGWLLVPVRDEAGALVNLQRIAPAKPEGDAPDKLFLRGGRKSGLWHMVGAVDSVGADDAGGAADPAVLLVAEGYATAASLHEATGYPAAVAFDAGNIGKVAAALRKRYPLALLVLCGDDDTATHERTGHNPGRDAATKAAQAVGGVAVFPAPLPDGGSDFNDLHQSHGLDAVRHIVQAAIDAHRASDAGAGAAQSDAQGQSTKASKKRLAGPAAAEGGSRPAGGGGDRLDVDPFQISADGVWYFGRDGEGKAKPPEWVCSRMDVGAQTRDQDNGGWGYLLTFADPLGHAKQWAMPARMLSGDGGEYRAALLGMGLRIAPSARARNLLTQYIQTRKPDEYASCTDRVGWHGQAFVLPRETIGDGDQRIVFQSENAIENTFRSKGDVSQWQTCVAALCAGNSRLVFAVACAFAGPLMRPAGMESGGFHYRGDSSSGKTTALKLAASVYGGPSYLQRWRATDNALEATAAQHSDGLLCLDELAQIDPKTAGECAYMLANEQGKARASRTGTPRPRQSWRLLFLSAGELGLADHMAEGMKRTRTGQEVRMADIPADAGKGMGAFESLHGHEGGSAFARALAGHAGTVYGAVGRAWLHWLTENADTLKTRIRADAAALGAALVPKDASGQVERVGARFALVGAAGELATAAGLTGWNKGESEQAASACFNAWLAARGGKGNGEVTAMLRQVRRFLEGHGEGRFTWWHRGADDHNAKTLHRAGFRRMLNDQGEPIKNTSTYANELGDKLQYADGKDVEVEYFVLSETFKAEVCQGYDAAAVARVLHEHDCLKPEESGRFDCRPRLPAMGLTRCYRITPQIFALDL